jgi:hypothetical protein
MIFIILSFAILVIFYLFYFFNIYEFSYKIDSIYTDNEITKILVLYFPINAFGYKIPFRKIKTNFKIISECDSLEILPQYKNHCMITFDKLMEEEKIRILAQSAGFISSTLIEIDLT